eukprot:175985-Chlamydomonas_euryale.AAC.1
MQHPSAGWLSSADSAASRPASLRSAKNADGPSHAGPGSPPPPPPPPGSEKKSSRPSGRRQRRRRATAATPESGWLRTGEPPETSCSGCAGACGRMPVDAHLDKCGDYGGGIRYALFIDHAQS